MYVERGETRLAKTAKTVRNRTLQVLHFEIGMTLADAWYAPAKANGTGSTPMESSNEAEWRKLDQSIKHRILSMSTE